MTAQLSCVTCCGPVRKARYLWENPYMDPVPVCSLEHGMAYHPKGRLLPGPRLDQDENKGELDMACAHCGSDADWYKLEDGRSRCPNCYATSDAKDAEKDAKEQLEQRDSTDKATTTPTRIDDEVAKRVAKDTK